MSPTDSASRSRGVVTAMIGVPRDIDEGLDRAAEVADEGDAAGSARFAGSVRCTSSGRTDRRLLRIPAGIARPCDRRACGHDPPWPVGLHRQQVGRADEVGDEGVGRPPVDLDRRRHLPDAALAHHDDQIGHGHRLALVVGDDDGGDAEPLLQLPQFDLHRLAQLGVERRKRLVEQEQLGRQRQARAIATRWRCPPDSCSTGRSAKPGKLHQLQQLFDPRRAAPPCDRPRMRSG